MKKKYNYFFLISALLLAGAVSTYAQIEVEKKITIESVVADSEGNPIPNVELYSERNYTKTGTDGKFIISMESDAFLLVKAKGYQSVTLSANEVRNSAKISLQPADFLYEDDQKVNLGFRKVYEGDLIGSATIMRSDKINVDKTVIMGNDGIQDLIGFNVLGLMGELSVRGLGYEYNVGNITSANTFSARSMILVDGMPRSLDYIRISEIESITVLKDANAAVLYGTSAMNGVILITTKRSNGVKKSIDFTARYGISTPKAMPKYLNSADYMTYYNMAYSNDNPTSQSLPFSKETIDNYRNGNKYRYPDTDYFSSEYIKPFKSFYDINAEVSGGNNQANYYANFGLYSSDDVFKIGYGKNARNDIYNVRVNTELRPNEWISIETDGRVALNIEEMPIANVNNVLGENYWDVARRVRPHEYAPLLPIDLINPEDSLLMGHKRDIDGKYLLGWNGNRTDANSLIGNMYAAGNLTRNSRIFAFTNRIHADLSAVTPGLSFHTCINFDFRNFWYQALLHQFCVYYPLWNNDTDVIDKLPESYGEDSKQSAPSVTNVYLNRWFGGYAQFQYDRTFENVHHLSGTLLAYTSIYKQSGNYQGDKRAHMGIQAAYIYDKRYMVDFSGAFVNSTRLPQGNRGGFSPTMGLAWVMSNEEFMQNIQFLDYLKIRVSGGLMKTDIPLTDYFMYDSQYNSSGGMYWYEGNSYRNGIISTRGENPKLTYVERKDVNVGLEAVLLDKSLRFETNLFLITNEGLPATNMSKYPSSFTSELPIENYNNVKYQGFEVGLNYTKTIKDWTLWAGVNALYSTSVLTKIDEVWAYDYLKREGRPVDAAFGLEALGLFKNIDDIRDHPTQTFGSVLPGDIKYKSQNDENNISVDDQVYLGRVHSPLVAGLQVNLSYKNIGLSVWGEAKYGGVGFTESNYYWMSGNNAKYSELVTGAWTESTWKHATYPRLTTTSGENNFRRSTYWMYKNNYFQIGRIQLNYRMPENISRSMRMKYSELFGYMTSPFLFSKNKDIMNLSANGAPYYRSFVLGLKVSF